METFLDHFLFYLFAFLGRRSCILPWRLECGAWIPTTYYGPLLIPYEHNAPYDTHHDDPLLIPHITLQSLRYSWKIFSFYFFSQGLECAERTEGEMENVNGTVWRRVDGPLVV